MSRSRVSRWRVRTKVSRRNPYSGIRLGNYRSSSFKSIVRRQRLSIYCPRSKLLKPKKYRVRKFRIRRFW